MPDDPVVLQKVPLQDAPGDFVGDVDVLLCAPDRPSVATAIEVKRVKIGASAFRSGQPNKLREYRKAVRQANLLVKVGFAQVYLYVIVVVDSRENNDGRYTYDGPTPELHAAVESTISLEKLEPRVGLVRYEFVQSMDHPPLTLGTSGGSLARLAQAAPQRTDVTTWVAGLVAARDFVVPPILSVDG